MKILIRLNIVVLGLLVLFSWGCTSVTGTRSFVNPNADFTFYKRVGLLPFKNLADDRLAGIKMLDILMTELLVAGQLDVVDPSQFNAMVSQVAKINVWAPDMDLGAAQLTQIAEFAKVQGIFMATIHDYKMVAIGGEQYPFISMIVKFIDAPTGTVAWQYSINATGGPNFPIVSIGDTFTLSAMSQKVSKKIVSDFYKMTMSN